MGLIALCLAMGIEGSTRTENWGRSHVGTIFPLDGMPKTPMFGCGAVCGPQPEQTRSGKKKAPRLVT